MVDYILTHQINCFLTRWIQSSFRAFLKIGLLKLIKLTFLYSGNHTSYFVGYPDINIWSMLKYSCESIIDLQYCTLIDIKLFLVIALYLSHLVIWWLTVAIPSTIWSGWNHFIFRGRHWIFHAIVNFYCKCHGKHIDLLGFNYNLIAYFDFQQGQSYWRLNLITFCY